MSKYMYKCEFDDFIPNNEKNLICVVVKRNKNTR